MLTWRRTRRGAEAAKRRVDGVQGRTNVAAQRRVGMRNIATSPIKGFHPTCQVYAPSEHQGTLKLCHGGERRGRDPGRIREQLLDLKREKLMVRDVRGSGKFFEEGLHRNAQETLPLLGNQAEGT